jgi:hypothetical protein
MSIVRGDFQLFNRWKVDTDGERYRSGEFGKLGEPKYLIDQTTGRKYGNETKGTVRLKCFLLCFGTPIAHSVAAVINVIYRIVKLVTLSHFWIAKSGERKYNFTARLADAGKDVLRILLQPFSIIGLELSALFGVFTPYNGRKLYATIERAEYGSYISAPCFQPDPTQHLFGGNTENRDAW